MVSKWNKDGSLIASAGQSKTVQVWNPNRGDQQVVKVFNQENDIVDLDW
jgi:WD40 repeat protein